VSWGTATRHYLPLRSPPRLGASTPHHRHLLLRLVRSGCSMCFRHTRNGYYETKFLMPNAARVPSLLKGENKLGEFHFQRVSMSRTNCLCFRPLDGCCTHNDCSRMASTAVLVTSQRLVMIDEGESQWFHSCFGGLCCDRFCSWGGFTARQYMWCDIEDVSVSQSRGASNKAIYKGCCRCWSESQNTFVHIKLRKPSGWISGLVASLVSGVGSLAGYDPYTLTYAVNEDEAPDFLNAIFDGSRHYNYTPPNFRMPTKAGEEFKSLSEMSRSNAVLEEQGAPRVTFMHRD